jgi:hypothetical protein
MVELDRPTVSVGPARVGTPYWFTQVLCGHSVGGAHCVDTAWEVHTVWRHPYRGSGNPSGPGGFIRHR